MKLFISVILAAVAFGIAADAAPNTESQNVSTTALKTPNAKATLQKGSAQIGGGFNWYGTPQVSQASIYPSYEYFFMDRVSLGGSFTYQSNSTQDLGTRSSLGIGPSVTYYFYILDQAAYFLNQKFNYTKYSEKNARGVDVSQDAASSIGIKFFATNTVAFGVDYSHHYQVGPNESPFQSFNTISGNFSFYY